MTKTVLVFGASGHQGKACVERLFQSEEKPNIRAFCRFRNEEEHQHLETLAPDVNRLQCFQGDIKNPEHTRKAMTHCSSVVIILQPSQLSDDIEEGCRMETEIGKRLVYECIDASVRNIVYSSVCGAGQNDQVPHFWSKKLIERELEKNRESFNSVQIVRPVWFFENFDIVPEISQEIQQNETFTTPLSSRVKLPLISVRDVGYILADCSVAPRLLDAHNNILECCVEELPVVEMAELCGFKYEQCSPEKFTPAYQKMFQLIYEEQRIHPSTIDTLRLLPTSLSFRDWAYSKYPGRLKAIQPQKEQQSLFAGISTQ
ncbi:hypothetical protein P9112_008364 [Eukaryota sp. TZLM1-RC]